MICQDQNNSTRQDCRDWPQSEKVRASHRKEVSGEGNIYHDHTTDTLPTNLTGLIVLALGSEQPLQSPLRDQRQCAVKMLAPGCYA